MDNQLFKDDKNLFKEIIKKIFNDIIEHNNNISYKSVSYESRSNKNIYSFYHNLIKENIHNSNAITFILHTLSKEIFNSEIIQNKIKLFNLLPEFFFPFLKNKNNNISSTYPYLSRILTVIQNNLSLNIQPKIISSIFRKIILIILNNENEYKKIKKYYEICQGFCFYNMKQNEYKNQIYGVLCLNELITNTNYYLESSKYIKNLYEKIILFIDNNNFEPKEHLIDLLKNFILKCQQLYKPYVNITFYKLLNYLETDNKLIKHKIIDSLGLIIALFPHELRNINDSLINFLTILTKDKDNYIKNKSIQILNEFNNKLNFKNSDTSGNNTFRNKNYSTVTFFHKNSAFFNNTMRSSWMNNNIKNDSTLSKSTRYTSSRQNIRNNILFDYNYKNYINENDYIINKKNRKNSARTLNINYFRNHNKFMKENFSKDTNRNCPKILDRNKKSLIINLNKLKNDINDISYSLNDHVNKIENKVLYKNLNI